MILTTGYASVREVSQAHSAGVTQVLEKPYDPAELLASIRRAADSKSPV